MSFSFGFDNMLWGCVFSAVQVATVKFISLAYILMDVIPVVGKLNLFFQKENVDVALVKVRSA